MEHGIIYKVTNLINGKCYIGQTTHDLEWRKKYHIYNTKYCKNYFLNALKKYGENNFNWEIIDTANSQKELDEKEKYYISFYKTLNKNLGYNLRDGGNGGTPNEQARLNMSKAQKKRFLNPNELLKLSKARKGKIGTMKGKHHTEENKIKMREISKLSYMNGRINNRKGIKLSEETKQKIRDANKNMIFSEETRKKISEGVKGIKHPQHRLTESQVYRIKWIAKYCKPEYRYWTKIAKSLNVSLSMINKIIYNENWKHIEVF